MSLGRLLRAARQSSGWAPEPGAVDIIQTLPVYQVALWPDGWDLDPGGAVTVRDTHEMAEARRWYQMAARNGEGRGAGAVDGMNRAMRLHGVFVPRAIVDLAGRRFASEQAASVAMQLIAGDWVVARRRRLLATPQQALAQHDLAWSGSRHQGTPDAATMRALLTHLLDACIAEALLPKVRYHIELRTDDGYGIRGWTCTLHVDLDPYARARVAEAMNVAVVPWKRTVIRDGRAAPLIAVRCDARRAQRGRLRSLACMFAVMMAAALAGALPSADARETAGPPSAQDGRPPLGSTPQPDGVLRFFALGDLPYSDTEHEQMKGLMQRAVRGGSPFIVHVGDIKGGGEPCTDRRNAQVARLFRMQPVPVLYTPGDNEWTDCHRLSAGAHDPLERLAALRTTFFADPAVLRRLDLGMEVPEALFPENGYFIRDGVLLALVHVVGSGNHHRPGHPAPGAELTARSAANRALIEQAISAANQAEARAFVLIFHANPSLERSRPPVGFRPLHEDLRQVLAGFPGPVLAIHGDTHEFRLDQPLKDLRTGAPIARFWRLEVPGSPLAGGVWVSVEAAGAAEPFSVDVVY